MSNSYTQGRLVRVEGTFYDPYDTTPPTDPKSGCHLVDPDDVYLKLIKPDGTVQTLHYGADPAVIRSSQGEYFYEVDTTALPGHYKYYWYSTGTGQTAGEKSFYVIAAP